MNTFFARSAPGRLASLASVVAGVVVAWAPAAALARGSLLEQPAVRHKLELRTGRIELVPTFDMTVAADLKDTFSGGAKLEYHISDLLSFGGNIFFGASRNSSLGTQIRDSLPDTQDDAVTPTKNDFDGHANTTTMHGSLHATITPFFGKMGFFGKAYPNFDVYLQGGLGFASLKNTFANGDTCTTVDSQIDTNGDGTPDTDVYDDPRNDCPHNAGFQTGLMLGAGIHLFFNEWIAADISFRDYFYPDNPSGLDYNADRRVDNDDRRFMGHMFFGLGVSMFLPPKAKRSP